MHVYFNLTPELVKQNIHHDKTMMINDMMTIQYNDKQSQVNLNLYYNILNMSIHLYVCPCFSCVVT